jgi:hypothetical protein
MGRRQESRSERDGRIAAQHDKRTGTFAHATIRHASYERAADMGEEMLWVNAYRAERDA